MALSIMSRQAVMMCGHEALIGYKPSCLMTGLLLPSGKLLIQRQSFCSLYPSYPAGFYSIKSKPNSLRPPIFMPHSKLSSTVCMVRPVIFAEALFSQLGYYCIMLLNASPMAIFPKAADPTRNQSLDTVGSHGQSYGLRCGGNS